MKTLKTPKDIKKKSYRPIQNKLFVYFLIFMLIPSVLLAAVFGAAMLKNQININQQSKITSLDKNIQQLNKILTEASHILQTVSDDKAIIDLLMQRSESYEEKLHKDIAVSSILTKTSSYFDKDIQIFIFSADGGLFKSGPFSFSKEEYSEESWYQLILKSDNEVWLDLHENSYVVDCMKKNYISVGMPVKLESNGTILGIALVEVCVNDILFPENNEKTDWISFLYNPNMQMQIENEIVKQYEDEIISVIADSRYESAHSQIFEKAKVISKGIHYWEDSFAEQGTLNYAQYKVFYGNIPVNNWILVSAIPLRNYYSTFFASVCIYLALLCLCVLMAFRISERVAKNVTTPILELKENARSVQEGNFNIEITKNTNDEIGELSEQFGKMVIHIHKLMNEIIEEQEIRRNYELMLLNAQINPHFLYNTLDSLMWMIRIQKLDDAQIMLQSLTNFLKTGLNQGKDIIALKQETENVKSYLSIQKLRYKSKLEYDVFLDTEAENIQIPKLILQPLVENAIYHGIKPKEQGGNISVWSYLHKGTLILKVKDNGIGMNSQELNSLTDDMEAVDVKQRSSYGMVNVNERLQLFFKERYSISIESKPNMGTEVIIRIKNGGTNVQTDYCR